MSVSSMVSSRSNVTGCYENVLRIWNLHFPLYDDYLRHSEGQKL